MLTAQEIVYTLPEKELSERHCLSFFRYYAESKIISESSYKHHDGVTRCFLDFDFPFMNALFGIPERQEAIAENISFFQNHRKPCVWFVDEEAPETFKQQLLDAGLQNKGMLRGVVGKIETIDSPQVAAGYTLEKVTSEERLTQFNTLVCDTFGLYNDDRRKFYDLLQVDLASPTPRLSHFVALHEGKAVAAVTTYIDGTAMSFWNGATLPEHRRFGLSTALRKMALRDAYDHGCRTSLSYLMSDAMALGIVTKLGLETKWRFYAFVYKPESL